MDDLWEAALQTLRERLEKQIFDTWIRPIVARATASD